MINVVYYFVMFLIVESNEFEHVQRVMGKLLSKLCKEIDENIYIQGM